MGGPVRRAFLACHPRPCFRENVTENRHDLVELVLTRDQRRRDLDHRVAAIVGPADETALEETRREEAAQERLALLVVERLAGVLVLHELECGGEARAAGVSDAR